MTNKAEPKEGTKKQKKNTEGIAKEVAQHSCKYGALWGKISLRLQFQCGEHLF